MESSLNRMEPNKLNCRFRYSEYLIFLIVYKVYWQQPARYMTGSYGSEDLITFKFVGKKILDNFSVNFHNALYIHVVRADIIQYLVFVCLFSDCTACTYSNIDLGKRDENLWNEPFFCDVSVNRFSVYVSSFFSSTNVCVKQHFFIAFYL